MTLLIAEISNHHLGCIEQAKKLILTAKNCGADIVKGQAFVAEDMRKWGTMPLSFYDRCAFRYSQYKDLILYGDEIGIPVFFTILSNKLSLLGSFQKYKKLHAGGSATCRKDKFWHYDKENIFISMKEPRVDVKEIRKAKILYATEYMQDADLEGYEALKKFYDREIGVSHHGTTIEGLLEIHKTYRLPVVEKHFYFGKKIEWEGQVYRDCLHSMSPYVFEEFARSLK